MWSMKCLKLICYWFIIVCCLMLKFGKILFLKLSWVCCMVLSFFGCNLLVIWKFFICIRLVWCLLVVISLIVILVCMVWWVWCCWRILINLILKWIMKSLYCCVCVYKFVNMWLMVLCWWICCMVIGLIFMVMIGIMLGMLGILKLCMLGWVLKWCIGCLIVVGYLVLMWILFSSVILKMNLVYWIIKFLLVLLVCIGNLRFCLMCVFVWV